MSITDEAPPSTVDVDFGVSAEMYSGRRNTGRKRHPMRYLRFETLAEAIRFAVEDAGADPDQAIDTDGRRFSKQEIQSLYDSDRFPLAKTLDPLKAKSEGERG